MTTSTDTGGYGQARAICHELDHLEGHLYVEKVEGPLQDAVEEEE